ncbi:hypothetical protein EV715DRAFT_288481 [Schizophyllum commune]
MSPAQKFEGEADAESSRSPLHSENEEGSGHEEDSEAGSEHEEHDPESVFDPAGFAGPKTVKPLTREALAAFQAAQDRAGIIYISRIPPGMRPAKVRHLMSAYGEVGRVYLQQEDPKRAYLRKKYTSTNKAHFTEGWVEFKDKKIARSVAELLNAQPIGGKKGTRFYDDVWTMKYLPKFKWNMLTEQVAHEAAVHTAKLRAELQQSRSEQREYLKNVELARVLDKRAQRKKEKGEDFELKPNNRKRPADDAEKKVKKPRREEPARSQDIGDVLSNVF